MDPLELAGKNAYMHHVLLNSRDDMIGGERYRIETMLKRKLDDAYRLPNFGSGSNDNPGATPLAKIMQLKCRLFFFQL